MAQGMWKKTPKVGERITFSLYYREGSQLHRLGWDMPFLDMFTKVCRGRKHLSH